MRLLFFRRNPPPLKVEELHYGFFTVAPGDVILSGALFDLLLVMLERGTPEQVHLAETVRAAVKGVPK